MSTFDKFISAFILLQIFLFRLLFHFFSFDRFTEKKSIIYLSTPPTYSYKSTFNEIVSYFQENEKIPNFWEQVTKSKRIRKIWSTELLQFGML